MSPRLPNVPSLRSLVASGEEENQRPLVPAEVDAVPRSEEEPRLPETVSKGLVVTEVLGVRSIGRSFDALIVEEGRDCGGCAAVARQLT